VRNFEEVHLLLVLTDEEGFIFACDGIQPRLSCEQRLYWRYKEFQSLSSALTIYYTATKPHFIHRLLQTEQLLSFHLSAVSP